MWPRTTGSRTKGEGLHLRGWRAGHGPTRCNGSPRDRETHSGQRENGTGKNSGGDGVGGMGTLGWGPWDGDPSVTAGSAEPGDRGVAGTVPRTQPGPLRRRGRAVAAAAPGSPPLFPHLPAFVCGCGGGALPHPGRPMATSTALPRPRFAPPRRRYKAPHRAPRSAAPLTSTASASGCETAPDRPPPW